MPGCGLSRARGAVSPELLVRSARGPEPDAVTGLTPLRPHELTGARRQGRERLADLG